MWLSRKNSINTNPTSPNRKSNFNRHSFKNIDDLLGDDDKHTSNDHHPPQKPKQKPSSPTTSTTTTTATAGKRHSVFHRVRLANQFTRSISPGRTKPHREKPKSPRSPKPSPPPRVTSSPAATLPNSDKRVVVYMTSLGAVRPTFDACRAVRSILQGFRVAVDERDLSMDSSFKDELQKIMSPEEGGGLGLPRVFIGGRYVGDAEDMRQLNETGELKRLVEGLPAVSRGVCGGCGDFRFVICGDCNGSRKCYRDGKGVFRSCTVCNKNGLVRCPSCWTDVKC